METKTITLYKFSELSAEVQQKVIDENRSINVDNDFWDDWIKEDAIARLSLLGYSDVEILYSGFYSQGDGACFTGKANLVEWLKAHKLANKYRALYQYCKDLGGEVVISNVGHYVHENSMSLEESYSLSSIEDDRYNSEKLNSQVTEVMALLETETVEQAKEIYKKLENTYSNLMSDEEVRGTLEDTDEDNQFLIDGTVSNS